MKTKIKTAKTKAGKEVQIGTLTKVNGGWKGYIKNSAGNAVSIFVPGE